MALVMTCLQMLGRLKAEESIDAVHATGAGHRLAMQKRSASSLQRVIAAWNSRARGDGHAAPPANLGLIGISQKVVRNG